jgi:hypothetical protein
VDNIHSVSPIEKSRFKNPSGAFYTRGLFFEETLSDKSSVVYTLKDEDHLGYPSLHRLFIESADPTEYAFAQAHLYSWSHWVLLRECTWLQPYLSAWRQELEVKLRAEALVKIRQIAADATPTGFQANKYLLESPWKPADAGKRGRPSKEAVRREILAQAASQTVLAEEAQRVFSKAN